MNNKIKILIAFIAFAVVFTSCQKDFLDRSPKSGISDADYWKSANDLRLYINDYYNSLPTYQGYSTWGIYSLDAYEGTDNMMQFQYDRVLNGERTLPSSGGGWSYGDWGSIRSVNYFLDHYKKVSGDEKVIKKYLGEALFFKAWYYYDKLRSFGDVPWLSHALVPNDSAQLHKARLPRNQVVDSLMDILDKAVAYLPKKGGEGYEDFRVYSELAALFQSRIALYEGTWEKYHAGTPYGVSGSDGSKFLKKAAAAADSVISSGKFGIDNVGEPEGYRKLFNRLDYSNSQEVMFWRSYDPDDGIYTLWANYQRLGGGLGVTKSLVDAYLCTDGNPIDHNSLYQGDDNLEDVVTNRDPRLNQTIQVNDGDHFINDTTVFEHPAWDGAQEDKNVTGYQLYKGLSLDLEQQKRGTGSQGLIYFRYAEALLNYAEAKAELGTITQGDLDKTINLLRDRVGMPHLELGSITNDPNWKFPDLSPIINEVRRERRVETACEGYRHDDIWRWAAAGKLIDGWKPKGAKRQQFVDIAEDAEEEATIKDLYPIDGKGYIFPYKDNVVGQNGYDFKSGRDYLLPIPTDQLLLNPNLAPNNPGWD